jgi:hypothetical protein
MKTLYSIVPLLFYPLFCGAQFVLDSTRFITGIHQGTYLRFAIPTADKGILFVGEEDGNPGGIIPYFPIDTSYNGNVLIGKIDSNQQISWIKIYGGTQQDVAICACQTPDGGYAVLAQTESNDGDVTGFLGADDFWLLRIDGLGNLLWEKCYGSSQSDVPASVANAPDGGFIMFGGTNGSDDEVPFHYGDYSSLDWLVVKTDSTGNVQWSKDLGGTGDELQNGSILSVDSYYYLVSGTNSNDHDCTDSAWHPGVNTSYDYYILKLDDTGKVLWDSSYGGSNTDVLNYAFYDSRDSSIVCNGLTYSNDYMVTGYHGAGDFWIIKVNKNGTLIWEKALGGSGEDWGYGVCPMAGSGYLAIGSTGDNCWLFALDSTGNTITNMIFGGIQESQPYSILPYLDAYVSAGWSVSNVFTEGSTYGNFDSIGGACVSYIDYWPLAVKNINNYSELITVYPNPTDNNLTIITPQNISGNISFFNITGQQIFTQKTEQGKKYNNINVTVWQGGVYLIKWQGEDGSVETTKFIKI